MKTITSMENPVIRNIISLKEKKHRDREGTYLIEGFHICMEALDIKKPIDLLIFDENTDEKNKELELKARENGIKSIKVPRKIFKRISDVETPTGIGAIVKKETVNERDFFAPNKGNFLVLDRIRDPGNAGTLIRTSEAAGFDGVIVIKGTVDIYSPKVIRSAAGSILRQKIFFVSDSQELISLLEKYKKLLAVTSPYGATPYEEEKRTNDLALVIGNESQGVDQLLIDRADLILEIPMAGQVESLNAAVAGGILMYWFRKDKEENGR